MDIDAVRPIDINKEMRSAYLDYAMSVIVRRALPDARDGLKPVHRRILFAMNDLGMRSNTAFKKSARIVGEVLGKYHPHGDAAVYESMARMAQDFSLRYMLIDGQGNFGSIHGDSPAAMRYTEARLHRMAEEMLVDINQNTVDFGENFDGSLEEPQVLPARLPNLLLNGTSGIAVGMATNIPPHNLNELTAGLKFMLDNYDAMDDIAMEDLLTHIKGPDFPTGGAIIGTEGIRQAYSSGRGRVIVRGTAEIEERNGRFRIVVSEVPYQTNLTSLIERIAELVRSGRLSDISDLRDESDRDGLSIVIELKKWAQPKMVLNSLYKYTGLQTTFGVQLLALVNGEPRLLSLKRALQHYLEHRIDVITRRTNFQLEKARARLHILEGLVIALANLDAVIAVIRNSPDADQAKTRLMDNFGLSTLQAQAILDMQLRRLAALEQQKIEGEHREVSETIADLVDLLANKGRILAIIRDDLDEVTEKYGDKRRTQILVGASGDLNEEDLIKDESIIISLTERGYVKRVPAKTFRAQGRGGRGVKGHTTREKDEILLTIPTRTLHTVLYFSDKGKVYSEKAYQVPDASRQARGIPIINILNLDPSEVITAAVAVPDFEDAHYCTMMTRKGRTKRVSLSSFSSVRASGLIAITIRDGDELGWVRLTSGEDHIIVVTKNGRGLRFKESDVREMGRTAAGVIGIRMRGDDEVTSMEVVEPNGELLVVTTGGYGKRTPLEEYVPKSRGSLGVQTINKYMIPQIGKIASARVVQLDDHLAIMSTHGVIIRTVVEQISQTGRVTKGVIIMNLNEGDSVAAVARILAADLVVTDDDDNSEEEETFARSSSTPQEEDIEADVPGDEPDEESSEEDEE